MRMHSQRVNSVEMSNVGCWFAVVSAMSAGRAGRKVAVEAHGPPAQMKQMSVRRALRNVPSVMSTKDIVGVGSCAYDACQRVDIVIRKYLLVMRAV